MINFTVDYNDVLGKAVEEAGSYNVKIADSSTAKTTKKGQEMAVLDYEVLDGKYAGAVIRYDNILWNDNTEETLKLSAKRFNTLMKAAGIEDGTQINSTMSAIVKGLVGKKLNITVEWEQSDYNGKWNLSVKTQQPLKEQSEPNGVFRPTSNNRASATKANTNPFGNTTQSKQTNSNPFSDSKEIDIPDEDLPF
ncbi:DUF669 domain-containing protein [Ligilactobacillus salivarius]|jgi:hypothetical protein|uniref:DUF669 domain-containing protein n=1 Tax=Ligilactobacillus salivarius TaxID=1624 RepID=UPI001896DB9F|nr:DUF669 domain-containing protein [Ligilactobacillus salivarius]